MVDDRVQEDSMLYRIAAEIYKREHPFRAAFNTLAESERWPYYGAAEELRDVVAAAGCIVMSVQEKKGDGDGASSDSQKGRGARVGL